MYLFFLTLMLYARKRMDHMTPDHASPATCAARKADQPFRMKEIHPYPIVDNKNINILNIMKFAKYRHGAGGLSKAEILD
jgi:hypothetical protein